MKKRFFCCVLALLFAVACLPASALAAEEEDDFLYVALGDSITAGYGLPDAGFSILDGTHYEMEENFEHYSSQCFTALVAEEFGWSRNQALNLGLPGAGSQTLLEVLQTGSSDYLFTYDYPQIREYVKQADLISLDIGLNDAFVPYQINIFSNLSPKLEDFANVVRSGALSFLNAETSQLVLDSLRGIRLTQVEFDQLLTAVVGGAGPAALDGLEATQKNLPLILDTIRQLNPDADIILLGYANPLPLAPTFRAYFEEMNVFAEELAKEKGAIFVPVPHTTYNLSAHPSASGHAYISEQMIPVIRALGY